MTHTILEWYIIKGLLERLPEFDSGWSRETQLSWFRANGIILEIAARFSEKAPSLPPDPLADFFMSYPAHESGSIEDKAE